ncbi:MAG: hypothetical protein A2W23_08125 [Planctomycetes bacterium RBG_16_43_13]|nr:MAG: hypothetical protein A2W23_08125 [Planctomycetes bacterium RBG_16_43_13]
MKKLKFIKEEKMKTKACLIMILLIGLFLMTASAQAQTVCWKLDPYIDKIEVGYESHSGHYLVNGKWVASGLYFLPVVGSLSSNAPGNFNMGLHATNDTTYFGGYDNCVLDAELSSTTLNGTWKIDCGGGGLTNSGTLTKITCPIAASEESGTAAGE